MLEHFRPRKFAAFLGTALQRLPQARVRLRRTIEVAPQNFLPGQALFPHQVP